MINIVVVLLTCKQQKDVTLQCLESFKNVEFDRINILVWDNNSTDGTEAAVRKNFPNVEVQRSEENLGAEGGRNAGAQAAINLWNPEFLLFLDNDTVVTPNFIGNLVKPFQESPDIGITTPKIHFLADPERIDSAGGCLVQFHLGQTPAVGSGEVDQGQYDLQKDCIPGGCCMFIRTDVFTAVEGFDTGFGLYGIGDLDFSLRVKKAGYRCVYVPDALIYHAESQTFESGQYTSIYGQQKAKNWYRFVQKNANPSQKAAFWLFAVPLRLLSAAVREIRRGNLGALFGLLSGGWNALVKRSSSQ